MILIGYRHGLRASELCDLQWSQVELATGRLHDREGAPPDGATDASRPHRRDRQTREGGIEMKLPRRRFLHLASRVTAAELVSAP